jgi:ubiquinone/menaquinone biosynthesis C-methylase UbiE
MATQSQGKSRPVTAYFDGLADTYAQYRPTYPDEAIRYTLEGLKMPVSAADVGCGTGISSRLLAAQGAIVVGIDPNADMLERARADRSTKRNQPIEYRIGIGEHTGLDDASEDLVLCAQSFHWFDAAAALSEFHRILKKGGRLALLWNVRDDRDAFTAVYSDVAHRSQMESAKRGVVVHEERYGDPIAGGLFTNRRQRAFANPQELDLAGLVGRARSASYFPKENPLREQFEHELMRAFNQYQRNGRVTLHHQAEVTLADRV